MTRRLVSELEGAELDAAVALCVGWRPDVEPLDHFWRDGRPTTSWATGGQLIDRELIDLRPGYESNAFDGTWTARIEPNGYNGHYRETNSWRITRWGPTALVAAMRAFVAAGAGEWIDLP